MENKAYAFAAGLFTLLLGIGILLAAMWFSGETYEKVYYELESQSPVTGLYEQAAVRFRGVDVGKVSRIRFDRRDTRLILIEIGVEPSTPVTRGTFAEIRPQGVTGVSYVMLDDAGANPQALPPSTQHDSARIPVKPTLLENIFAASENALTDVREVAQRISAVLNDQNKEHVTSMLVGLRAATERIAAVAQAAEPGVRSIEPLVADARRTLNNADKLVAELSAATRELAGRMEALDRIAGSTEKASTSISALADSVTSESLPRINLLVDELARTTRGLDRLVGDVQEQPQSLVFGRRPGAPGPGEPGFDSRAKGTR